MKNFYRAFVKNITSSLINTFRVVKGDDVYYDNFNYWQEKGFHITPNHFYQPIPDTRELSKRMFYRKKMEGIVFDDKVFFQTVSKLERYKIEFGKFKKFHAGIDGQSDPNYYQDNKAFEDLDALVYYGLVRQYKPKTIIEIGSGWCTKLAAKACLKNGNTKLISIEPYPQPIFTEGFPGLSKLVDMKVEHVPLEFFRELKKGDFLFIDSSHVVKIGGDVNYEILEILPSLPKGVFIHFHDIFFPYDYPEDWVKHLHRFWSEQYLLQAFLSFNDSFRIIYSKGYLYDKYPEKMKKLFPEYPPGGGSLWIKKIR